MMKRIPMVLFIIAILAVSVWINKDYLFQGPRTFVKVYEGATSVYYVEANGEREFLGVYKEGESLTVRPVSLGWFSSLNVARFFVPQAVSIFKEVIGKKSEGKPIGLYQRFFTEEEFQKFISRKVRTRFWPDANVKILPSGFNATATLTLGNLKVPIYATGMVNVDKDNHGLMYVKFDSAGIGGFKFPKFLLNSFANASNKVMNRGDYTIEILDMDYRKKAIDIVYLKVEAPLTGIHAQTHAIDVLGKELRKKKDLLKKPDVKAEQKDGAASKQPIAGQAS